jgi:hypothetical protein
MTKENNRPTETAIPIEEFSARRFERAATHVALHWFPISPATLSFLSKGFESGVYTNNLPRLIEDLKTDFALFTYCVKELLLAAENESVPAIVSSDPIQLITWSGAARVRAILQDEQGLPRSHNLVQGDSLMLERLRETSIVAATSAVLSEGRNLNGQKGFCHGLIRQVGLNLVAWNYASLYSRVIRSLGKSSSLDIQLSKELGFSPTMLAMKLLKPSLPKTATDAAPILESWRAFDDLCSIGEALARADHPDTYPSAENDWTKASRYIQDSVGPKGIDLIRQRAVESTQMYRSVLPGTFASLLQFNPAESLRTHRKGLRSRENQFVQGCPAPVQAALRSIYAEMSGKSVNRKVLEKLVKEVIPFAGFTGGCVFLVDPSTMSLIPRTVIGKVKMRSLTPIALPRSHGSHINALIGDVITTRLYGTADVAQAAFESDQPVLQRSNGSTKDSFTGIYCCLGKTRKIGVLYLEVPEVQFSDRSPQVLKIFKALQQTLCHALFVE